jgi:hypothetical protein
MFSPRKVFERIPFARRTIKELESTELPTGVKIYPGKDRGAMAPIFPEICAARVRYRSMLMLVGKAGLPNSVEFVLPEEFERQDVRAIKRSRGAMVTFERRAGENLFDLLFTIYIDKQYCPEPTGRGPETDRLIKRSETFAMEYLCAVAAFKELRDELPQGEVNSVVPLEHPDFDEAFNLLCPDEEIIETARKFYSGPEASLKDILEFFATDHAPSNQVSLMPGFWDHWQYERRVRAHLVGKRIREIFLEISKHPRYKPKRPLSETARGLFEKV